MEFVMRGFSRTNKKFLWSIFLFFSLAFFSCKESVPKGGDKKAECPCDAEHQCVKNKCLTKCDIKSDCGKEEVCSQNKYCYLPGSDITGTETPDHVGQNGNSSGDGGDNNYGDDKTSNPLCIGADTCQGESEPCGEFGVCADVNKPCGGELYIECNKEICIPNYNESEDWNCKNDNGTFCCEDTLDNDCDNVVDTDEPECSCDKCPAEAECKQSAKCCDTKNEICDDGIDNNCDQKADCEDPQCMNLEQCCYAGVDPSTIIKDKSGNNFDGILVNGEIVAGQYGNGVRPKQAANYFTEMYAVKVNDCNRLTEKFKEGLTIEGWFYFDMWAVMADHPQLCPAQPYCGEFWLANKGGTFTFLINEFFKKDFSKYHYPEFRIARQGDNERHIVNVKSEPANRPPIKEWVHLAAVYDLGTVHFYMNGKEVPTETQKQVDGAIINSADTLPFEVARYPGIIDEIKLTNRAKTESEISDSMKNAGVIQSGTLVYFDFD